MNGGNPRHAHARRRRRPRRAVVVVRGPVPPGPYGRAHTFSLKKTIIHSAGAMTESGAAIVVRRPLSPRKFFAMLYETDAAASDGSRPRGETHMHQLQLCEPRRPRPSAPSTAGGHLHQAVVVVRPAAAYVQHTFATGLTAFREYHTSSTQCL